MASWSVEDGWWSVDGRWVDARPETVTAFTELIGAAGGDDPPLWFVREGEPAPLGGPGLVLTEDGRELAVREHLPADLPLGYHRLAPDDGGPVTTLIVTPRAVPAPSGRRWGLSCQVYALDDANRPEVGGLAQLRRLAQWAAAQGASVVGINPLGAPLPTTPRQDSPYSPSSRRFLDPLLVDSAAAARGVVAPGRDRAPAARGPRIDRDAAWARQRQELRDAWLSRRRIDRDAVAAYRADRGATLEHFCLFDALVERTGTGWPAWPAGLRRPDGADLPAAGRELAEEVEWRAWVQMNAERQLAEVRRHVALMGDLPVGVDPWGFDAWWDQDVLVLGAGAGAPPDPFAPDGQSWGLPPWNPAALRAAAYGPFLDVLRANLAHVAGLRIDHVMGLFRLFWVPSGATAHDGTYVRYPGTELLDLVALEAVRAGAWVVGEDLGTVEPAARQALTERGVAGTRVMWFEERPPEEWPPLSLATVSTHDLPTVMGALSGTDPRPADMAERLRALVDPSVTDDGEVLVELHRRLAAAGSELALVSMEDLVGSAERVNLPGGSNGYPSWCLRLAVPVGELSDSPTTAAVVAAMRSRRDGVAGP